MMMMAFKSESAVIINWGDAAAAEGDDFLWMKSVNEHEKASNIITLHIS